VHGISRNAGAHLRALAPLAEQFGCVLVAPHFSCDRFPDYQRFGRPARIGKGGRADLTLLRIVDEVRDLLALHDTPVGFVGHSGGAQFVQRFVLAHGPARHVLSAAGSYAWPAGEQPFPLGCAPSSRFADLAPRVDNLLQSSALVLGGDADDQRDASLRQGTRIDAEQGPTRKERARRYVDSLAALAGDRGLAVPARLELLPHCRHAFSDVVKRGDLAARTMRHLLSH
jgi:pimeloyl-ACP methyl ester carboxylesterase